MISFKKKKCMKMSHSGYTFPEIMIVLMGAVIFAQLTVFSLQPLHQERTISFFLKQFREDVLYAQMYALTHEKSVKLYVYDDRPVYELRASGWNTIIFQRSIPEHVEIDLGTVVSPIVFYGNGNIGRPGTLYIYYLEEKYRITFQIGVGRFNVEKE